MTDFRSFLNRYSQNWVDREARKDRIAATFDIAEKEYAFFVSSGLKTDPTFDSELMSGDDAKLLQRSWEIALGNRFVRQGFSVASPKEGPDFKLTLPDGKIVWVEAICPTQGTGDDAVPDLWGKARVEPPQAYDFPTKQIRLRWASVIKDKADKYKDLGRDAYVIAVNGALLTPFAPDYYSMSQHPYIVDVVYGTDCLAIPINRDSGKSLPPYLQANENINKSNNSPVPVSIFMDDAFSHVSAVIGTSWNWLACFEEQNRIEISLAHNKHATVPLEIGAMKVDKEFWIEHINSQEFEIKSTCFNSEEIAA